MKKFNSKPGLEFFLSLTLVFGYLLCHAVTAADWKAALVIMVVILFFIYLVAATHYTVQGTALVIKCGFFYNQVVDIMAIKAIKEVTDFFGGPATSVKRVEIKFKETGSVCISPKDKTGFIRTLLQLNPAIKLE